MIPSLRPHALRKALLAAAGVLALSGMAGISGCKPVELDEPPVDSAQTADSAVLRITNKLDIDPDILTFYLFPGTAAEFTTAANARKIGAVAFNATQKFTIPAGTWKLAYANSAGVLAPLRDQDADIWLKAIFAKDGDYILLLATDGPDIKWTASFPTSN